MRKKSALIIIIFSVIFFTLLVYFGYYFIFLLRNEYINTLNRLNILEKDKTSFQLDIANFEQKSCNITYCVLNNCTYDIELPCSRLKANEFNGYGSYEIRLDIGASWLYFWSDKQIIRSWTMIKVESQAEQKSIDSYMIALKDILEDNYLWQVYSIPVSSNISSSGHLFLLDSVSINFDYTKSLYLIAVLANTYDDEGLGGIFEREISYLNENSEAIIEANKNGRYPEAYILELINLGLNEEYLSLIKDFKIPFYDKETFDNTIIERAVLPINDELYSSTYRNIIRYADYYKIFLENDYIDLAEYSFNQMVSIFNSSEYSLYGICSVGFTTDGLIEFSDIQSKLEGIFLDKHFSLIEGNVYELIMCQKFSNQQDTLIEGLNSSITTLVQNTTLSFDEKSLLVRGLSPLRESDTEYFPIVTYNTLDNLMYLISYEE